MIRNLQMQPELVADVIDPEAMVNLMTDALDLYCDQLIAKTKDWIVHPGTVEMELAAVISQAIIDTNPHLRNRFEIKFSREEGNNYAITISIDKSTTQQHLEQMSGSMLCH